jgi:hypothetical protein
LVLLWASSSEEVTLKAILIVQSNPLPGKEAAYNDWYSNQHLKDLRQVPGITAATRYKLADARVHPGPPTRWRYVAIYELEADDIDNVASAIIAGTQDGSIPLPEVIDLDDISVDFFTEI